MKILIYEDGVFWNVWSGILEEYAEDTIVVSYGNTPCFSNQMKKQNTSYSFFYVPGIYGLDGEYQGMKGPRYYYLSKKYDELKKLIGDEDVLVLADSDPFTMLPYKLLQSMKYSKLHLWILSPFRIEHKNRHTYQQEMIADISGTKTFLYTDINGFLENVPRNTTFPGFVSYVQMRLLEMLPQVIDGIQHQQ